MKLENNIKKFWSFLKQDTWQSWIVSLFLAFLFIKFIFFPSLSFVLATPLPLVVVESCSMYHSSSFDTWWDSNGEWYKSRVAIEKEDFKNFKFKNGLNKGDIVLISGRGNYDVGDVIVFESSYRYPLIHRLIKENPYSTKGDNGRTNPEQLPAEVNILSENVLGKSVIKIPGLGWIKLIFFEGLRPEGERGFCK